MTSIKHNERGFSPVELGLTVVIVVLIGFVGWYVYHVRQTSSKSLDAAASTSANASPRFASNSKAAASGDTSNASLQKDLSGATSASNSGSQDLSSTNNSLNDSSTLTSVPQ